MSQYNPYGNQQSGQGAMNYGNYGGGGAPPPQRNGMSTGMIIGIILGILFLCFLLCGGVLAALLIPAISAARAAATQVQDSNNMRLIGLALHNYEATYKKLPTPYATNSNGEKVWSWRIAMLPFIEDGTTFQKVDFKNMKPWDDPSNTALQGPANPYFTSVRSDLPPGSNGANIFLISNPENKGGPNSAFVDGVYTKFSDCSDGISNTLVGVLLVKHNVPWASPETLSTEEAYRLIQNEDQTFIALFLDGSVKRLKTSIDEQTFKALVTRDGGEQMYPDMLEP